MKIHLQHMRLALAAAELARQRDEVPIGAIVIDASGKLIGSASNRKEQSGDPTHHAEIVAIRRAAVAIGDWRLQGCSLYCTLEPCAMCYGAIVQSRIPNVYYGAPEPKFGVIESQTNLNEIAFNHQPNVQGGILADECRSIIQLFFARRRGKIS